MSDQSNVTASEPERLSLRKLKPHPKNPRKIEGMALSGLGVSLEAYGDISVMTYNVRTDRLVAGHQRVKALGLAGATEFVRLPGPGAGTDVGRGYIDHPKTGERFEVRFVDWDEAKELSALLAANNQHIQGQWTKGVDELLEQTRVNDADLFASLRMDVLLTDIGGFDQDKVDKRNKRRSEERGNFEKTTTFVGADEFFALPTDPVPLRRFEQAKYLVVQFSGGKDSLGALIWAGAIAKKTGKKLFAFYVDTGVEMPFLSCSVQAACDHVGAELTIVRPDADFGIGLMREGWPNLLHLPCRHKFIHKPTSLAVKAAFPVDTEVIYMSGMRSEESTAISSKSQWGSLWSMKGLGDYFHYAPCYHVQKKTIEHVIKETGTPIWPGYSRGFVRTACWCCPAQRGLQALALQKNYPGLADEMRRMEKRLGPIKPLAQPPRCFDDTLHAGEVQEKRALARGAKLGPFGWEDPEEEPDTDNPKALDMDAFDLDDKGNLVIPAGEAPAAPAEPEKPKGRKGRKSSG